MIQFKGTPVLDRIIIKQSEGEDKVQGTDIVIPDSERKKPCRGVIVAVGPGARAITTGELIPMVTKVGDDVIYMEHNATKVNIEGIEYLILKEGSLEIIF